MAKAAPPKPTEPARFRLIVLEAELPAGSELGQIIHAVQNAVRPAVGIAAPSRTTRSLASPSGNGAAADARWLVIHRANIR